MRLNSHYEFRNNLHQMGSQIKTQHNFSWNSELSFLLTEQIIRRCKWTVWRASSHQTRWIPDGFWCLMLMRILIKFKFIVYCADSTDKRNWNVVGCVMNSAGIYPTRLKVAGGAAEGLNGTLLSSTVLRAEQVQRNSTKTWKKTSEL